MRLLAVSLLLALLIIVYIALVVRGDVVVRVHVFDYGGEPVPGVSYLVIVRTESGKSFILVQGKTDSSGLAEFTISEDDLRRGPGVIFYKGTIEVGGINLYFPRTEYEAYLNLFDVEVSVVEADGDPVDHAVVKGYWEEIYGKVEVSGSTGEDGEPAVLEDVPPVPLSMEVYKLGVKLGELEVSVGPESYNFKVPAGLMADVFVKVVDAAGNPIEGASVYLASASGMIQFTEKTNSSGYVVFTGVPEALYYVGATFKGYISEVELSVGRSDVFKELQLSILAGTPTATGVQGATSGAAPSERTGGSPGAPPAGEATVSSTTQSVTSSPQSREAGKAHTSGTVEVVVPPEVAHPQEEVTVVVVEEASSLPLETVTGRETVTFTVPAGRYIVKVYSGRGVAAEETVEVPSEGGRVVVLASSSPQPYLGVLAPALVTLVLILLIVGIAFYVRSRGRRRTVDLEEYGG